MPEEPEIPDWKRRGLPFDPCGASETRTLLLTQMGPTAYRAMQLKIADQQRADAETADDSVTRDIRLERAERFEREAGPPELRLVLGGATAGAPTTRPLVNLVHRGEVATPSTRFF
jgi:hypothetical protein